MSDVTLTNRTRPEESLQYAVFNQGLKFAVPDTATLRATSTVNKPSCDFNGDGVDDASPTIVVLPSSIAPSNGEEIISWTAHAADTAGVTNTWDVWISLITPSSAGTSTVTPIEPTAGSMLFFSTKCAPR